MRINETLINKTTALYASRRAGNAAKIVIFAAALLVSTFYLFWNLDAYSLWEDETHTALAAKGIVRTGVPSAFVGDGNLAAYANGRHLHNLQEHVTGPIASYLTALSFYCFGETTWSARFPHALLGLLFVALMLYWVSKAGGVNLLIMAILIVGNMSLFLFFKQSRYYALNMFFTLCIVYLYWNWKGGMKHTALLTLSLLGLMLSNAIAYVAVGLAVILDFLIWRRKEVKLTPKEWMVLLIPQIAGLLFIYLCYNPLTEGFRAWPKNSPKELMAIFYWHIRDLNRCEFYSAFLMICGLAIAWYHKKFWIYRALFGILVIGICTTIFSTQIYKVTSVADIRFMVPLIPLFLLVEMAAVKMMCGGRAFASAVIAAFVVLCNFGNGGIFQPGGLRSTAYLYARELVSPVNSDPFKPTAAWIRENIPAGASIYVEANSSAYPLMFLAPKQIYAWQLENRNSPQFKDLDPIYFKGEIAPDYIIAFGPQVAVIQQELQKHALPNQAAYRITHVVDAYSSALYRPELFWRTFTPISGYPDQAKIFIFKRDGVITPRIPKTP